MATFAGQAFEIHSPGKAWSFSTPAPDETRFEIRKGDQFSMPGYTDPIGTERCEIGQSARPAINQLITTEYQFMVEPGAKITSRWLVIGQMHSALNASPPLQIAFRGNDRMIVLGAHGPSSSPVEKVLFTDSQDIVRGKWYTMKLAVKLTSSGAGYAVVDRDGVKIVDYVGPLGYSDQTKTYWKQGVYRSTAPETVAVRYKGLKITLGNVPDVVETPPVVVAPDPVPEAPRPPNVLEAALNADAVWRTSIENRLKAGGL